MPIAKKLPSGSWHCMIYDFTDDKGKRHYKSFTSKDKSLKGKRICEKMAAEYAATKESRAQIVSDISLGMAIDRYISLKKPVLSPSTIKGYTNINNCLKKDYTRLYGTTIGKIDRDMLQIFVNNLFEKKSEKTVRNYYGLISASLENCGMTIKTPTLPKPVIPDLPIPNDADVKKLCDAVKDTELEIPVMLSAFCSMRRGEICALSMDDIDDNVIHIKHSMVLGVDKQWHIKQPKTTASDRYIEVPQFVVDRIREKGYITKLNPHSLSIMFGRVLEQNDIKHFRFHALRSYSVSIKHSLGYPDIVIQQDGGWATNYVMNRHYKRMINEDRKKYSAISEEHFKNLLNGNI